MLRLFKHVTLVSWFCACVCNIKAQTNINRVEYYVDTDPGYGNATTAPISVSPELTTSFNLSTGTWPAGLHIIGVRSRAANGAWSMDERWLVLKPANPVVVAAIERVEWYLDTDPGFGNATAAVISPTQETNSIFSVNTSGLASGIHIIGVRSRNTNKAWSPDERWLLLKQPSAVPAADIDKVEWYIDKDPGYGNAIPVTITAGQNLVNLSIQSSTDTLRAGLHIIGVRSRNSDNTWSLDERWLIVKQPAAAVSADVDKVEWFVDKDPGYGNANVIVITPGQNLVNLSFQTLLDTLSTGLHIIGVRSRNTDKAWSIDERWLVFKQSIATGIPNIKRIEYYIDADPGKGRGIPIAFLPGKDITAPPAFVNITGLTAGTHKLLVRSLDNNNTWSFDDTVRIVIPTAVAAPFINVSSVAFTNVCAAGTFSMAYHATGTYNAGNQFIAELSDDQGNFAAAQTIGSVASVDNGGLVQCNMPAGIIGGSGYKMRVRSTSPPLTGDGSNQSLSVSLNSFFLGNDTFKVVACAESRVDITQFYNAGSNSLTWSIGNPGNAPVGIHSVYAVNPLGCKDTAMVNVILPTAVWTGTISDNWHDGANWNTGLVPTDTIHVVVPAGTTHPCIISASDAMAASVHVKGGEAIFQILNGRKLLIKSNCRSVPN